MKTVRIYYVDFWKNFDRENFLFTQILRKEYEVVFDKDNPEIVFCSVFGTEYLKYKCPRVVFIGEPQTPDFNLYDYAVGFDYITFMDRYIRFPLYLMNTELYNMALNKSKMSDEEFLSRKKFCSFVVSAGGGEGDIRTKVFNELSKYKKVDSGGRYMNNLTDGNPVPDKLEFQKDYRFSISMENSAISGYTTEKIIDAWAAGTIPIYWGNPDITKEFNKNAFINVSDFESIDELVKYVTKLDSDEEAYLRMCHEPIISIEVNDPYVELEKFLVNIVETDENKRFRRSSRFTMWGKIYEYNFVKMDKINKNKVVESLRKVKRKFFGLKRIE